MQKTIKISFAWLIVLAAAFVALTAYQAVNTPIAAAQEGQEQEQQEEVPDYTYTAQSGDTYTQLARKAIQTYGINNSVNLTSAGIVYAETHLTQEAGSEVLAEGQEVTIDGDLVKQWAESAGQLSEAEQAAWEVYVPFVNFNTDSVGESS